MSRFCRARGDTARRVILTVWLIMAGAHTVYAATGGGAILHEERSTGQREPVRLRTLPLAPESSELPVFKTPENVPKQRLPQEEREAARERAARAPILPPSALPRPTEHLVDQMDVYALSPHAAQLAGPRMVSPQLARRWHEGPKLLPGATEWETIIRQASLRHGLPLALIAAVIKVESNFDPTALSSRGAQGLLQLMPDTQRELGVDDPFDPESNVMAGSAYLRRQLDAFGTLELALAAYNAGPGNVARYGGIPPFAETRAFIQKVLAHMHNPSGLSW